MAERDDVYAKLSEAFDVTFKDVRGGVELESWRSVPCRLWHGATDRNGYGRIHRKAEPNYVHVATWVRLYGPLGPGEKVLHYCDVPPCYEPLHLWKGTQADNVADAVRKGRMSRVGNPKITPAQRDEIKERYRAGEHPALLAAEYRLDRTRIWQIGGRS
jgi:hypothetical protein